MSVLKKASFTGCILENTNFTGSELSGVRFDNLTFTGTIFDGASMDKLTYAVLKGNKADLTNITVI